jgi:hypothetical protein
MSKASRIFRHGVEGAQCAAGFALEGNKKAGPDGTGFLLPARHRRGCTRTLTGS